MPKAKEKNVSVLEDEEVIEIEDDGQEEDPVGHGVINSIEAKLHV